MLLALTLMAPKTARGRDIHLIEENEYVRIYNVSFVLTAFGNCYLGHQLVLCWQIY